MINLILGAPGAGKSYEAVVYHVLVAVTTGRKVVTNLPLNIAEFEAIEPGAASLIELRENKPGEFAFSELDHYETDWRDEHNRGPLFVIDECHKPLSRGSTRKAVEEWFAEHRHHGVDVLLITQSHGKVNRSIIDMVQIVWRCRKNTSLGSNKTYVRKTLDGVRGAVLASPIRHYKPEYFKLYKSHTASDGDVIEAGANEVRPIWKHWSFIGAGIFLTAAVALGLGGMFNPFAGVKHEPEISKTKPVIQNRITPTELDKKQPTEKLPEAIKVHNSGTGMHPFQGLMLHVAGVIQSDDRMTSLFVVSQNGQRVFLITGKDIVQAGYDLEFISSCAFRLSYPDADYKRFITCDVPSANAQVSSQMRGGVPTP